MRLVFCALLISGSLLGHGLAVAQSDDELAKRYYKLGEELYNRADYEGAYKQFQQSYEISKRPALLFNMARCQESLGQHEKAIELLTEYLSSNPDNRTVIEARIANLRRLVERKRQEQASPPPATAPVPTL
jgi:tetratricopeptide (TPR) repeat protein